MIRQSASFASTKRGSAPATISISPGWSLFTELESAAEEQTEAFLGTPGSLAERTNEAGIRFWVHRYSDATGRRREIYLGKVNDAAATELVATLRGRIESANAAIAAVRILARSGFATVDRKAYATLASLHNHGLFRAGALLIGSHAYGALLNAPGVRAAAYATQVVDIARREVLALPIGERVVDGAHGTAGARPRDGRAFTSPVMAPGSMT